MGLKEIEEKILAEARAKALAIREDGTRESAKIGAAATQQAETRRQSILAAARLQSEEERKAIVVPARLLAKQKLLEEKHRLIDQVFAGLSDAVRENKESEVIKLLYG
ncbi:MAG: V-type ATP synthase subunit E family protein [Candidatus Margulisiibacteriota bacterium]|jgi:vacuolar-type H+-ATPase subunit E/Vma4